ncbi:phage tail tape measure protein, partial [Salmonella enterica]|nr:phage tail tape measure protein [Salmonella enterica]
QSAVTGFADKAEASFKRIGFGVAGLWGAAQGLKGIVDPARDMEGALAEVSSLDVANKTLDQLRKTSQNFAVDYGESASAFVRSAYDIQSAIAGLQGDELPKFTEASAILAKATKSDTGTITSYMGTMYGIFKNTAEKMGRTEWVQQVAGQTATAVQMFKTTGNEMSAAFTALGANAQAMKVSAAEQFAVLGQLQSTMSGSEAGTKYKSFLAGIGNAQKALGLNFTRQDGSAKGITDIIDLIKGKFGDLSKVSDADLLKKAFGSDEAVSMIKLLAGDIDGLKKNINSLGDIKGMDKAVEMAKKMVDPWDQVNSLLEQVRVSIGLRLDPVFAPFLQKIIDGGKAFMKWLDAFPNIARWLGYIATMTLAFAAAGALASITMGTFGFIMTGLSGIAAVLKGAWKGLIFTLDLLRPSLLSTRLGLMGLWIQEKAVWVWSKLVALWAGICKVAIAAWNVVLRA